MRNPKLENTIFEQYLLSSPLQLEQVLSSRLYQGIYFELGCGNGQFTTQLAQEHSAQLVLACDIDHVRVKKTVKRAAALNLSNFYGKPGRGEEFLSWLPRESLDRFYINFPDPWPKKRHHKRRFFYDIANLNQVIEKLKPQGRLYFATDHEEYFFFALQERLMPHPLLSTPFEQGFTHQMPGYYTTLYEEKFRSEGKEIYYTYFEKISSN